MDRDRRAAFLAFCLSAAPTSSSAAPGEVDPDLGGFGTDGRIEALGFNANAMVIDAQGRLVLAGTLGNTFAVQRRSGPRFMTAETVPIVIDLVQQSAVARAVAIAPDGKIVVAGSVNPGPGADFAIVRLNPDLTLDETFSGDGKQTSDFDAHGDEAYGVAVQTLCGPPPRGCDHRITVVGEAFIGEPGFFFDSDFAVERLNEDGSLDSSFADDGKWTHDFDLGNDSANGIAVRGDGKIVLAGTANIGHVLPDDDFAIARLNLNGTLDGSFDGDGLVVTSMNGNDRATSVALGPEGQIVVAGQAGGLSGSPRIHVRRYLANGAPDTSPPLADEGVANAVVVQPDGRIVVAARADLEENRFLLLRYDAEGLPDATFDADGRVVPPFAVPGVGPSALVLQPDGMLVAAGGTQAARLRWDGSLDAGGSLWLPFHPGHTGSEATALAAGTDGRLVAAGKVLAGDYQMALARFEANYLDGLDLGFGSDSPKRGTTLYGLGGFDEEVRALALQPDGKPVVAGQIFNVQPVPNFNFLVGRLDAAGVPDLGCDGDGRNAEDFGISANDTASAVALGPDNRIYAAGTTLAPTGSNDFGLMRFATGCLLDQAGNASLTPYRFRFELGGEENLGGVVLQPSGLPVLAGVSTNAITLVQEIVLIRVLVNRFGIASLDSGFGTNGQARLDLGSNEGVTGLAPQGNGKLIVSGTVDRASSDFWVARFTANGQLDTTFGTGGVAFADFGGADTARSLAVRSDGFIALAGTASTAQGLQFAAAQFTESGSADASFNGSGRATLRLGAAGEDVAQAVSFVGADRLVLGGYSTVFGIRQFALAALETSALADLDSDGIGDLLDNCPYHASPDLSDLDLDGRGNVCECSDQNGDGFNTVADLVAINLAIFDPARVTPLCDGNRDDECNVSDILAANIEIFSPTSTSTCARYPVPGP